MLEWERVSSSTVSYTHLDVYKRQHQTFVHADGEKLPFKDKEFDYVICNQVLEHVEHPEAFVKDVYKRQAWERPTSY